MIRSLDIVRNLFRRAVSNPRRQSATLSLMQLESRENPAVPVGLTVPMLIPSWPSPPTGYEEPHAVTRTETNTVTVDQSGTGVAGTFAIDVVGSAESGDTASGSGESGETTITTSGTGNSEFSYHLVTSGTYANGVFTVTSQTYTETGSYSWTRSYEYEGGFGWTETHEGDHTLSWSAALDENEQLTYTSYSYSPTDTTHWVMESPFYGGGYTEYTYDTSRSFTTTGSGDTATYSGSESWHEHSYSYAPGDPPYEDTWEDGETTPLSGTVALGTVNEPTYDWQWRAGTLDATNFTFHGVAEETASLTESATHRFAGSGWEFDVNSFESFSHTSDSGHVVEDVPGVPESGTGSELFHRDETFSAANDVTGSGWYVGGSAYADYQAVETGSYEVNNRYTVNDSHTTGFDEDDEPYDLLFNFDLTSTGSGTTTITHDFHDDGDGLENAGSSYVGSASSEVDSRAWGTRNGVAFDDVSPRSENWSSSFSISGSPGTVGIPSELEGAFPLRVMTTPNLVFFVNQPVPTTPVRGKPGLIQDWYNNKVREIGEDGKKKVVKLSVQRIIMADINDAQTPRASGTFDSLMGQTFADGQGIGDKVAEDDAKWREKFKQQGYTDVTLDPMTGTKVRITYAVDQAAQNPRSGNVVAEFRILFDYKAKYKGNPISPTRDSVVGNVFFNDGNLKTMTLQP